MSIDVDIQSLILERLKLCYADVTGVITTSELEPVDITPADLPLMYSDFAPSPPSQAFDRNSYQVVRTFYPTLLFTEFDEERWRDNTETGLRNTALTHIKNVQNYFWVNPYLQTISGTPLGRFSAGADNAWSLALAAPVQLGDGGMVTLSRDQKTYAGIEFSLLVSANLTIKPHLINRK